MISDAQFAAWLEDSSAQRVTLFEVGAKVAGEDKTRYLSNRAYTWSSATPYQPVVAGGLKVAESISMDGAASLAAGDIELNNGDGSLDSWLDDIWANQPINAYVGDVRWDRADFRQVFSGTVIDIGCRSRDRLSLRLTNKLERLNTPVSDVKIGGTNATNPDALVPVLLGECHNINPVQTNPATLEYAFGDGSNEGVIEVRTDGRPRADVTVTPSTGRFVFTSAVGPGAVTCSAQGTKYNGSYVNTIGQLVQYLVTQRGKASTRFTSSDLDTAQLAAFETANPQPVGLWLTDRTNVLLACQHLAASVGAQLVPSMTGKLRLIQFAIPTSATTEIRPSHQMERSITIVNRTEVSASVKIGYAKNWTVQANLQTILPDAHKNLYAQEWLSVTATDATVQANYKLDAEPVQVDTCLLKKTDAQAEASRRLAIVKVPRTTYQFEATPSQLLVELGQAVKLFSSRFGLANGKFGLVTSRTVDWSTLRSTLEVTV
jgi:hypothetical protein